jgi:hypothetical protein
VREEWARYEAGEIAHIENVLKGELKERLFERTDEQETTVTTEREVNRLEERGLHYDFVLRSLMCHRLGQTLKLNGQWICVRNNTAKTHGCIPRSLGLEIQLSLHPTARDGEFKVTGSIGKLR